MLSVYRYEGTGWLQYVGVRSEKQFDTGDSKFGLGAFVGGWRRQQRKVCNLTRHTRWHLLYWNNRASFSHCEYV